FSNLRTNSLYTLFGTVSFIPIKTSSIPFYYSAILALFIKHSNAILTQIKKVGQNCPTLWSYEILLINWFLEF
ncbi:MAG TPA: hypothetical protein PK990_10530, partial [Salinivirgaceae bacterium]|nr:hypothetical protein [Salinivirgaceae bacterium]